MFFSSGWQDRLRKKFKPPTAAEQMATMHVRLQTSYGEHACKTLKLAVQKNVTHRSTHQEAGPMWVSDMPNNDGRYSVIVFVPGMTAAGRTNTAHTVLQLDIDAKKNRMTVQFGSYGTSTEYSLDQGSFYELLGRASDHVRTWLLYTEATTAA